MLRTNARITPLQAMLRYRELLVAEDLFRTAKALLRNRPIYHSSDAAVRGHMFCSFLVLVLRKELHNRCRAAGFLPKWMDVLLDLNRLQETRLEQAGKTWTVRTEATGVAPGLFKALGLALPPASASRAPEPANAACPSKNTAQRSATAPPTGGIPSIASVT